MKVPVSREHLISVFDQPDPALDDKADIDAWLDGDQHVQPSVERARRAVQVLRGEVEVGEPEVGS